MKVSGFSQALEAEWASPLMYHWPIGEHRIPLNPLLGKTLNLTFLGKIHCIYCQRLSKTSFNQGYCYPCFKRLARCDLCVLKPEQCHYHLGTCREPRWGESHCMQEHILYLANTSGLKVGLTRASQLPKRWIDQGASQAIPLFKVKTRQTAGLLEDRMRSLISDKTDWRAMLKNSAPEVDLAGYRQHFHEAVMEKLIPFYPEYLKNEIAYAISYPVLAYPTQVKALHLHKIGHFSGTLLGIRGQYLLFEGGHVLNIRALKGYQLSCIYS